MKVLGLSDLGQLSAVRCSQRYEGEPSGCLKEVVDDRLVEYFPVISSGGLQEEVKVPKHSMLDTLNTRKLRQRPGCTKQERKRFSFARSRCRNSGARIGSIGGGAHKFQFDRSTECVSAYEGTADI